MNAITYTRVSTNRQTTERQSLKIIAYCEMNNYDIVKEFSETESGFENTRDILTQALDYVKNNNVDYFIVDELSRLGRNEQVITSIKQIHDCKTGFISLKESIKTDISNEAGLQMANLLITFLSGINTFEIATFKYRSKAGLEKSIKNGGVIGSLNFPYGYKNDGNKKLVINEKEAEVIKKIFELYSSGNGTTLISNYLNDNNISTRSKQIIEDGNNKSDYNFTLKWSDSVVYGILKNSIYKGDRKFKGEILHQSQLQIIDNKTFDEVQLKLKANYNKGQVRNPNFNYILPKKMIVCGVCGRTYFARKRESGKDNRYVCLSTRYKENCGNPGISITKMEKLIQDVIMYVLSDKLMEVLDNKDITVKLNKLNNELTTLNNNLIKNNKEEKNLVNLIVSGEFTKAITDAKLQEIKKKKKFIHDKLSNINTQISELENTKSDLQNINNLRKNFKAGNKLPIDVISKIISRITIKQLQTYPEQFNKVKGDKVLEIKIQTKHNTKMSFLISQRTNFILAVRNNKIISVDKLFYISNLLEK
jgi:DNA invertase Pin-like site-specific DNA recombinase